MSDSTVPPRDPREAARAYLADLLPRVMADGRVDPHESEQLLSVLARQLLTVAEVQEIFRTYLQDLTADVLEDGVVTDEERRRCQAAVRELGLPRQFLPPELLAIVDGKA